MKGSESLEALHTPRSSLVRSPQSRQVLVTRGISRRSAASVGPQPRDLLP